MKNFLLVFAIGMGVTAIYYAINGKDDPKTQNQESKAPSKLGNISGYGKLSDFTLKAHTGEPFQLTKQNDKILIMNFFFSRCQGPCPVIHKKLQEMQESFKDHPRIQIVSITVDPENDTVDHLKLYAERYKAKSEKWIFLTGDKERINFIMEKDMKLAGGESIEMHSTSLVLLDKDKNVRAYYDTFSDEDLKSLFNDATLLANEVPNS